MERRRLSTDHRNVHPPCENHDDKVIFSSWDAWTLTRKQSKQNLLEDANDIDPTIQKHMTISSAVVATSSGSTKEVARSKCRRQQCKGENYEQFIMTNSVHTTSPFHDLNQLKKQRCLPFPSSSQLSRNTKHRRLNYNFSRSLLSLGDSCNNCESDHQYVFWKKLNVLTGNIKMNAFDPRR